MKKFVKPLVIATSVAAIAGIGAVSFAAWSAGGAKKTDTTGQTGNTVTTIGNITVTSDLDGKTLVPYDQATSKAVLVDATNAKTVWKLTIANDAAADTGVEYSIGYTATKTLTGDLYFSTTYDGTSAIADTTGWTKIEKVIDIATEGSEEYGHALAAKTVYVILASTADADKGVTLGLTVVAKQGDVSGT